MSSRLLLSLAALTVGVGVLTACSSSASPDTAGQVTAPSSPLGDAVLAVAARTDVSVSEVSTDQGRYASASFDTQGPLGKAIDALTDGAASVTWNAPAACDAVSCQRVGTATVDGSAATVAVLLRASSTEASTDALAGPGRFTITVSSKQS